LHVKLNGDYLSPKSERQRAIGKGQKAKGKGLWAEGNRQKARGKFENLKM